ncbi:MAG: SURF1 family protein [Chloroflexota bacterium]|nr:SURF1 family protein [Chloroflexota bacterium]
MVRIFFTGRRLWMTLLVIIGALILGRLGSWQLDRLAQRHAFNSSLNTRMAQPALARADMALDPDALEHRRVSMRGEYDPAQEIVLRNRELDGTPGVHVLTPLRLSGSDTAVLVDRGWLPRDQADPAARKAFAAPSGEIVVTGIARRSQEDVGGPQDPPLGPERPRLDAWFRVNIGRIQQQTGYPLLPIFIEQQPAAGDPTLPRPVPTADLGEGPHMGYAVQWFAFAIILVVGYIAFTYTQAKRAAQIKNESSFAAAQDDKI